MEQKNKPENPFLYPKQTPDGDKLQNGITLRDHCAGLAMQALVNAANTDGELRRVLKEECYKADMSKETYIAYNSYRIADAMLTERQRTK